MIPKAALFLARFCKEVGLFHFVLSPGSRSAPLVLALNRIGGITFHTVADERSAGFVALGMAIGSRKPVGLLCTSGTAVLNYGPAIAEAFYQQIPLFILTADRPPEWIDQNEGQAIRQNFVFQAHTRFSAVLPSLDESEAAAVHTKRLLNQAWYEATSFPKGPVHLNVPFREPLYPTKPIDFESVNSGSLVLNVYRSKPELDRTFLSDLAETFNQIPRRMVVVGQMEPDWELRNSLKALAEYGALPVAGDFFHNIKNIPGLASGADWFSNAFWGEPDNHPELLITTGKGLISKPLKRFLASLRPKEHWHVCLDGYPPDPFGTLTRIVHCDPSWFFSRLAESAYFQGDKEQSASRLFQERWTNETVRVLELTKTFVDSMPWSDFGAMSQILKHIPTECGVFIGNSMPIRYANWLSYCFGDQHFIYSNRGTSGIDGCVSTAVGLAKANPDWPLIAVVGDLSFFYDRNGLLPQPLPSNLKIAVLNNGGGNIFRIIPGSGQVPELEELFELNQPLSARRTAEDAGMGFFQLKEYNSDIVEKWLIFPHSSLLECVTDKYANADIFRALKEKFA